MLAWDNKLAKGFNTTDVPLEFCLLQSEVAEAFNSWRKGRVDVGAELADVAIYLFGLAQMTGIDLQEEIEAKIARQGSWPEAGQALATSAVSAVVTASVTSA
jgi:hypothetical protein